MFSYVCKDDDGRPIDEGMGTTVDVSQGGIMIETSRPIDAKNILLVTVDKDKKILEIEGKVVHTRTIGPAKHLTGIEFMGSRKEVMTVVKNLVIQFHSRKNPIR